MIKRHETEDWQVTVRSVYGRASSDQRYALARVFDGEIYARASTEAKRRALEAAYTDIVTDDLPEWNQDPGLLTWLAKL